MDPPCDGMAVYAAVAHVYRLIASYRILSFSLVLRHLPQWARGGARLQSQTSGSRDRPTSVNSKTARAKTESLSRKTKKQNKQQARNLCLILLIPISRDGSTRILGICSCCLLSKQKNLLIVIIVLHFKTLIPFKICHLFCKLA